MPKRYLKSDSGNTLYAVITDLSNQFWNGSAMEAYNVSNWLTYDIAYAEIGSTGMYYYDIPSALAAGEYLEWVYYGPATGITDLPWGQPGSFSWSGTDVLSNRNSLLNDAEDSYWIDIQMTHNETDGRDEYAVVFHRNDVPQIASQVTSPTIAVENLDGTDRVPSGALTQVATKSQHYRYVTTAGQLLEIGKLYKVICAATINGQAVSRQLIITLGSELAA